MTHPGGWSPAVDERAAPVTTGAGRAVYGWLNAGLGAGAFLSACTLPGYLWFQAAAFRVLLTQGGPSQNV